MFLLINKPVGWTSFDVIAHVRKLARQANNLEPKNKNPRVGHAGTLDPFATGLLIVGVGREATRRLDEFKNLPKTYIATLKLGAVSDTFDKTGKITPYHLTTTPLHHFITSSLCYLKKIINKIFPNLLIFQSFNLFLPEVAQHKIIENVLKSFIGAQHQLPPMFSAKKVNGKKLYELARKGITIKRKKTKIEILDIKILEYIYPLLKIEVNCSSGTYIRTLANDIGKKLGCGAYCEELTRTKVGNYSLAETLGIGDIKNLKF